MGQHVLDSDSFGGVNGDSLSTYNAKWSLADNTGASEAAIRGTPGIGTAGGGISIDKNTGQPWTDDHWAELKVDGTNVPSNCAAVGVRFTGDGGTAGNGYFAGKNVGDFNDDTRIWKVVNNIPTTLGSPDAHVVTINDILNLEVVGTTLTLRLNGSVLITLSDATFPTGGNPALRLAHSNNTDRLAGTWKAGSVDSGVPILMGQVWL